MKVWAIGVFGIAGALLRYLTGLWVGAWWEGPFPLGTLLINLAGCFVLGWFSTWAASRPGFPAWLRLGVGTGLIGAFTTFSTFSVETMSLLRADRPGSALLYVLLSLIGGLAFAWTGYALFRLRRRPESGEAQPS